MSGARLEQLVVAAARGDQDAAEVLFARAARLAYARALQLTDEADAAWDVAQDALVSAIQHLADLRQAETFFGWLRAIVDRTAAAHRGRLSRRHESPLSAASHLRSPGLDPAKAVENRAMAVQVRRAMGGLPPRDRVIVELFYFEDMTCREVAEFLKTTRDAVKTALHRSRMRMRKEMTTMATTTGRKTVERPIGRTMSGGDARAARQDLLFEHDSRTARFYVELYPIGDAGKAGRTLGMSEAEREAELSWLDARKFVARKGDLWRCTMPVMNDSDLEIVRPWAEQVTAPVTAALDDLYARLAAIAGETRPACAKDTVIAAGLYAEAARRPFNKIMGALETSVIDRGEFGKRNVAAVSAEAHWPKGYSGGIDTAEWTSDKGPEVRRHYFLWPSGTDRSDLAKLGASLGEHMEGPVAGRGLMGFLCSLSYDPISVQAVGSRAGEFGLKLGDVDRFVADLEQLGGIVRQNGQIELAIPVVPRTAWQPFLDELDQIGGRIVSALADAAGDLRERMTRCSFAECDFSDSVGLCMGLAQDLVGQAISKHEWVEFPDKADCSWGIMFVY